MRHGWRDGSKVDLIICMHKKILRHAHWVVVVGYYACAEGELSSNVASLDSGCHVCVKECMFIMFNYVRKAAATKNSFHYQLICLSF